MKDQILKGYVDDFRDSFELDDIDDSTVFEHFVNYCITSKQYPREFDYDAPHVGGADDIGLDGAAFIVNGNIVKTPEEIDFLVKKMDISTSLFCLSKQRNRQDLEAIKLEL